eukprot:TCALIF_05031-PA protein Name:"Similar to mth2 G-protein coupled receptor Mth2 (Drosophila simulans)" AED:0.03 eAED:0.03 QI:366/0.85/0.75/1/0.57/0.75/8/0/701
MKLILILIALGTGVQSQGDEIVFDSEDQDVECNFYESDYAENCHHRNYPNGQTLRQILGGGEIRECCHDNGYLFFDHCGTRPFGGEEVCGYPFQDPTHPKFTLLCPSHCTTGNLDRSSFEILPNGTLHNLPSDEYRTTEEYCVAYHCDDTETVGWSIKAQVCECADEDQIAQVNAAIPVDHPRCCPQTLHSDMEKGDLGCPRDNTGTEKALSCSYPNMWYDIKWSEVTFGPTQVSFPMAFNGSDVTLRRDDVDYCLGVEKNPRTKEIESKFMYCHTPCFGQTPCINSCTMPGEFRTDSQVPDNMNYSNLIGYRFSNPSFGLDLEHMDKLAPLGRLCPKGHDRNNLLRPDLRCSDEFIIEIGNSTQPMLRLLKTNELIGNFCLNFQDAHTFGVELCQPIRSHPTRLKFYPYIIIASSVFLLLTFVVYTIYPKLLNLYTKLMPFAQQYFFLTAFMFMTLMSVEVSLQIGGRGTSRSRYLKERIVGYSVPISITLLTLLIEIVGPSCSTYRPRFAEERCFFADRSGKFFWFYLPITGMLVINMVMFVKVVIAMTRVNQEKDKFQLQNQSGGKRTEKRDRSLLYIRLAIGMGLIWFFEILAGMSNLREEFWYFTDILNMCQGFYIFFVFVCKRNVFKVIFPNRGSASRNGAAVGPKLGFRNLSQKMKKTEKQDGYNTSNQSKASENNTKGTYLGQTTSGAANSSA